MQLYEKYRPHSWDDVCGQDKIIREIDHFRQHGGLTGAAYWFAGPSGRGKTTMARLLANECADPFNIEEFDAGDLSAAYLRELHLASKTYGLGSKTGRAYIVNEAHTLKPSCVGPLLTILEDIAPHMLWIFTSSKSGQQKLFDTQDDMGPLMSRCRDFNLAERDLTQPMAKRLRDGAIAEGLDGQPIAAYVKLLQSRRNNMRDCWIDIQRGIMLKK